MHDNIYIESIFHTVRNADFFSLFFFSCGCSGRFVVCFLSLYVSVGILFYGFLQGFMATRKDDGLLWIWFCVQACFAVFLFTVIATAVKEDVMKGSDVENPLAETESKQE